MNMQFGLISKYIKLIFTITMIYNSGMNMVPIVDILNSLGVRANQYLQSK